MLHRPYYPQRDASDVVFGVSAEETVTRKASVFVVCAGVWLLWSGLTVEVDASHGGLHINNLLLGLGISSCALVVWLGAKLKVLDQEGHPYHLLGGILGYLPWLFREVVLSNISVARIVLSPRMGIHSHLIRVPASQKTVVGQVIHANTITLTPGTITLDLRDGELLVHALTLDAGDPAQSRIVDERIVRLEGNS